MLQSLRDSRIKLKIQKHAPEKSTKRLTSNMDLLSDFVFSGNVDGVESMLKSNRSLASAGISLPDNPILAHPLHRICDSVFNNNNSEDIAIELAKIFLSYGANINGENIDGKDSPLTAACSLGCDKLALFYIQQGAKIGHRGCHGGTALHWSSWCGRDVIVTELINMHPDINQLCIDFKSTPLFWAIHGYKFGGAENRHHQINCARALLAYGADRTIPNFEGYIPIALLDEEDHELRQLLSS